MADFKLTSAAFQDGHMIPVEYARTGISGGQNISVPLEWTDAPEGTKSFALICVDRSPVAGNWVHWAVINIPASVNALPEGASPGMIPAGAVELRNTFGNSRYDGPQPPRGTGVHDYEFTIYALKTEVINIPDRPAAREFEGAVRSYTLAAASLTGSLSFAG